MESAARFLAGTAVLTVAMFATTTAMPAGAARHAVPGEAGRRASLVTAWIHIAGGGNHTCGIREGNTLWCWGRAAAGELGTGQATDQSLPQQIAHPTAGWTSVTAGEEHACALRNDGALWCWGFNGYGQLGIGNTADQDAPQQVTTPAGTGWTSVGSSLGDTCATRTHTLWCWGSNFGGQLGIGNTTDQALPQQVKLPSRTGWSLITLGESHTCATQPGHALWCWGFNRWGQLGIGNFAQQDLPQQVTS